MRTLLIAAVCALALPAQASRLKVQVRVAHGTQVLQRICVQPNASGGTASLNRGAYTSSVTHVTTDFPGAVSVHVSGGVPPYRYDWHGQMGDASTCSAMAGIMRVTVSDAEGNSVTRTAHIGTVRRFLPAPCDNAPLSDPPQVPLKATGMNYFGSAKPVKRSAGTPMSRPRKPDLRGGIQYIPPGPPQGGQGRKVVPVVALDNSTK